MQKLYGLKGVVQPYSWGGNQYIPHLLGIENKDNGPFAEYWLGAHPNHPASVSHNETLMDVIRNNKEALGENVLRKFSSLPYLLKVLDVAQMLSIQVHPSKASAEEGYAKENEQGIPVKAPHRNYKDDNHKPELMAALSDFWLLHGFKAAAALNDTLSKTPELRFLQPIFNNGNYKALYEKVMNLEQGEADAVLGPLLDRVVPLYQEGRLQKESEDFWAARAALTFCKDGHYDKGIFSIYFFNLLHLQKGQGIYQPAGLPHAYLEGQNVEIMANSDNVLRAGLTDKHVDVPELMKHVVFRETIPKIIDPSAGNSTAYDSPAEEFGLISYALEEDEKINFTTSSADIILCLQGKASIKSGNENMELSSGSAVFIPAGTDVDITASEATVLYRSMTPVQE
jgi:mannose-6-phosphate isomerase